MRTRLHTALIEASGMHSKRSRQEFQKMDLSYGQPKVLEYLLSNENCPQNEIAEQCMVEPATMTVLLRNMVNRGLITKKAIRVSCGKRAYGVSLTDLGREKALQSLEIIHELEETSYKGFSEEEKDNIITLLQRLTCNLSEE
jgi:DNA-binding MarR family transcriptional regulator